MPHLRFIHSRIKVACKQRGFKRYPCLNGANRFNINVSLLLLYISRDALVMIFIQMSFIEYQASTDFPIQNIPFGIISTKNDHTPRPATAIGNFAVDLKTLANAGAFKGPILSHHAVRVFSQETLNQFMALGRSAWKEARATLQDLLSKDGNDMLRSNQALQAKVIYPFDQVHNHLPCEIGDYTDFYASKEHATK